MCKEGWCVGLGQEGVEWGWGGGNTVDKSPMQRGFIKNNAGDLLPALRFLGRLCNVCNFVIVFFNHNGM